MLRLQRLPAGPHSATSEAACWVRCPLYGIEVSLGSAALRSPADHQCNSDDPCPLIPTRAAAQSGRNGPTHIRLRRKP